VVGGSVDAAGANGSEAEGVAVDSNAAGEAVAADSRSGGAENAGRASVAPPAGRDGRARESMAETRVAKSPRWKFMTAICVWRPWMAAVKASRASVGMAVMGGGGGAVGEAAVRARRWRWWARPRTGQHRRWPA